MESFDIIVVGGGHAGAEAAHAAARLGLSVGLFSINMDTVGRMPCSPSIGGLAKSHLVKEIDALGGIMGQVADKTAIQYRLLNTRKGPAVQATRTQNDRFLYEQEIKARLEKLVQLKQFRVDSIEIENGQVCGIRTQFDEFYAAKAVIIAAGTFLAGVIHIGQTQFAAGRSGEEGSYELAQSIKDLGLVTGRHKTGTPPRLNRHTIDLGKLQEQVPEYGRLPFSLDAAANDLPAVSCHIGRTSSATHAIIRRNIELSPLYSGAITGSPARYCPSLEDKIMRFGDRQGHQIIIEPEGLNTAEVYASGLGNSMPLSLQKEIIQSVEGLENAEMIRPGYAIEYDYVLPSQLKRTLECKRIEGLYLAGQINGTSGYEEAGGQGLLAGINAALKIRNEEPFILDRSRAYIGVMVDDLTTQGTSEPYRMFTSRAEYRLMLRQTNALFRLSDDAYKLGLIDRQRLERVHELQHQTETLCRKMESTSITIPDQLPKALPRKGASQEKTCLSELLKRPEINLSDYEDLIELPEELACIEAEVEIKYAGYIERQLKAIEKFKRIEKVKIPQTLDYMSVEGLSNELKGKLSSTRPETLGQAASIQGMTPAGLTALQIAIRSSDL